MSSQRSTPYRGGAVLQKYRQALRCALLLSVSLSGSAAAQDCSFAQPDLLSRPGNQSQPTEVVVRMYINDMIEIRDVEQSFTSDIFLRAEWDDPRLVHTGAVACALRAEQVWTPRLQPINLRSLDKILQPELAVSPAGRVSVVMRGIGEFSFFADLSDYPFDQQTLSYVLVARNSPSEVLLRADASTISLAPRFATANWVLRFAAAQSGSYHVAATDSQLAMLNISLHGTRLAPYYIWKLIVPLVLVMMMSWAVFWLAPVHVAPRVGLASTAMLTLIAYRFALASVLPPIAYLTRMDIFLVFSSLLVFAALAVAVCVTYVADRGAMQTAENINRAAR